MIVKYNSNENNEDEKKSIAEAILIRCFSRRRFSPTGHRGCGHPETQEGRAIYPSVEFYDILILPLSTGLYKSGYDFNIYFF